MPQAEKPSTTRRALFAATPAAALLAVPLPSQAGVASYHQWMANEERLNNHDGSEAEWDAHFAHEDRLMKMPCHSLGDAYVKLSLAALSFDRGDRLDKADERAVNEVIAYLRGRI